MIDLESIQEMWKKDTHINMDNLHDESIKVPSLHAKYFEIYNTVILLKKKAEQTRKNVRHERYEYFTGKADPEVYVESSIPQKSKRQRHSTKIS